MEGGRVSQEPIIRVTDPTFGELSYSSDLGWRGNIYFSPIQREVTVSIKAEQDGPTDGHRALFKRIEREYSNLLPEISRSLAEYTSYDCDFELCDIEISADNRSDEWFGQYTALTEEEDFMGYFVQVVDWKVAGIMGID